LEEIILNECRQLITLITRKGYHVVISIQHPEKLQKDRSYTFLNADNACAEAMVFDILDKLFMFLKSAGGQEVVEYNVLGILSCFDFIAKKYTDMGLIKFLEKNLEDFNALVEDLESRIKNKTTKVTRFHPYIRKENKNG